MRRLSDKEFQERRAKGLCFKCDDKWVVGHRCKRKELSVILLNDDDDDETMYMGSEPPPSPTEEISTQVSLNSVIGLSSPKTMELFGKIENSAVVVMVDPDATHNLISLLAVKKLRLPIVGSFGVSLGNGEAIRAGACDTYGGIEMVGDFLPLEFGEILM